MASSSPSPSPSYFTHLPLPPSSTFLSGEKSLEDDGSRVSIHIVTTASQLPVEFLEPSPQTQLVIGFDCEGVDLCRNGTHFAYCSSLIEAFCMAILEAASCGLLTVSTRVGGVPEVLPDDMIVLAEPDPSDMVRAIQKAVTMLPNIDPQVMHNRMRELYSWHDVARRTEIVYDRALKCSDQNLLERLSRNL